MSDFSSFPPDDDDEERTKTFTLDDIFNSVAPGARKKQAALYCLTGRSMGKVFHLNAKEIELGRDGRNYRFDDPGISRHHAVIKQVGDDFVLSDLKSTNGTICNGTRIQRPVVLSEGDQIRLGPGTTFRFEFHDELDEQVRKRLYELATRDALTSLLNRRAFLEQVEAEQSWCQRHRRPAALLWFDIDHFKRVNDTWGHQAGDEVLRTLGSLLRRHVRREDTVGRVGGEEFAALGRDLTTEQALTFGERLRARVERERFMWESTVIPVTISVGVARCLVDTKATTMQGVAAWIAHADQALYQAKETGRNRVVLYTPSEEPAPDSTSD